MAESSRAVVKPLRNFNYRGRGPCWKTVLGEGGVKGTEVDGMVDTMK